MSVHTSWKPIYCFGGYLLKDRVAAARRALELGEEAVIEYLRGDTKGGTMAEGIDLNEEEATRGGEELEEVDPVVEAGHKEKEKDPDTLANPTELQQGGGGDSPGLHSGGPAEL